MYISQTTVAENQKNRCLEDSGTDKESGQMNDSRRKNLLLYKFPTYGENKTRIRKYSLLDIGEFVGVKRYSETICQITRESKMRIYI